jgi:hypothetical protein
MVDAQQPTAEWLAQQIVAAFPWDTAPTYLLRDNDKRLPGGLHTSSAGDGDSRPTNLTEISLAKCMC